MKKFLLTAVVLAAIFSLSVTACARYVYVAAARDSSGNQTAQFALDGLALSSARFTGPQDGWASSGTGPYTGFGISGTGYSYIGNYCYYCPDGAIQKWGEWTFSVPDEADKSGYYDVYYGVRYAVSSTQDMPPIWTMSNASGTNFINSTQTSATSDNVWVRVAEQLQFNRGQSYTTKCASPGLGLAGKRMNFDMVAWVFVKTNTATNLTATVAFIGPAIELAWTAPDPAPTSYTVQRRVGLGGTWEVIATGVTATSYTDETCPCCPTSYYRVACVGDSGVVSGYSNEASECRCVGCPPEQAFGPNPQDNATEVQIDLAGAAVPGSLSWTSGIDTESHDVYFGTDPTSLEFKGNQTTTSYDPGDLLPNSDYYWRVDAKRPYAMTTVGSVWHFRTITVHPVDPPLWTPLTRITDMWPLINDRTTVYGFAGSYAKTVSAVWPDGFWVEETDRNAGARLVYSPGLYTYFDDPTKTAVQAGDVVDVYGTLSVDAGNDRTFVADYIRDRTVGAGTPIRPLIVTEKYLVGKQASANTPGLPVGKGIYNAGLFVKCAGTVVGIPGDNYFFLDDKTFAPGVGIKVLCGTLPVPTSGNKVVTGVVGMVANSPVIYATNIQ